jgi:NAD(P)-dependent dehydrogenase (short-subunit alcohol dehydrogenase family)
VATILVTGASRGIGAAIAAALAEGGFTVGCVSRSGQLPVCANLPDATLARFIPLQADITDDQAIKRAFEELLARSGSPLVGLVNNAGIHEDAASQHMPRSQWDAMMNTNAFATVLGCQAAHPYLVAAGGGLIVNMGSFFDKLGVKRNLAYCASKAAVGAITRVLAVEWAKAGIRVVDVAPGYVMTDLNQQALNESRLSEYLQQRIPRGKPGTAQEIAAFIAMLFVSGGDFLSGETIYVDGGQGIAH